MGARTLKPSRLPSLLAAGLLSAAMASASAAVAAQETGSATVIVNIDVLERLGPEQPTPAAGAEALKSGSLLAPPAAAPRSRLVGQFEALTPAAPEETAQGPEAEPDVARRDKDIEVAERPEKGKPRKARDVTREENTSAAETETPLETVAEEEEPPSPAAEMDSPPPPANAAETAQPATAEATQAAPPETPPAEEPVVAETAEVPAVPAVPEGPGDTQTAAVSPRQVHDIDERLLFSAGSAELAPEERQKLLTLADRLQRDPELRIQLLAFAANTADSPNAARRLSLSRALAVRGFLIDQGISATRVQVRALGQTSEDGPADRVDIKPQGG